MKTVTITEENVIKAIKAVKDGSDVKNFAAALFPTLYHPQNIMERVQTFDDVLEIAGITLEDLERGARDANEAAYRKAQLIASVYNEGTILDPMDTSQYKYYPWHKIDPASGFGLSYGGYAYWFTNAAVGSRLCFKSKELAIDAGKKFIEIYATLKIK